MRTPSEGVLVAAPTALAVLDLDPFEAERAGVELPCRAQDPELWFAESPADLELAKSHCLDCPVRRTCLAGALVTNGMGADQVQATVRIPAAASGIPPRRTPPRC